MTPSMALIKVITCQPYTAFPATPLLGIPSNEEETKQQTPRDDVIPTTRDSSSLFIQITRVRFKNYITRKPPVSKSLVSINSVSIRHHDSNSDAMSKEEEEYA